MAFRAGKNGFISINAVDLSAFCTNVDGLPGSTDTLETTTYGKNAKTFIPGLRDSSITCTFVWDSGASTPDAILSALLTTPAVVTLIHKPSTVATVVTYTVSVILKEWKVSVPVGGLVTGVASFQGSDVVVIS